MSYIDQRLGSAVNFHLSSTSKLPFKLFKNIFADAIPKDSILVELAGSKVPIFKSSQN